MEETGASWEDSYSGKIAAAGGLFEEEEVAATAAFFGDEEEECIEDGALLVRPRTVGRLDRMASLLMDEDACGWSRSLLVVEW